MVSLLCIGWLSYRALIRRGLTANQSGLIALIFMTSPVVLLLGQTFMTDLPFLAFFAGALLCFPLAHNSRRLIVFLVLASLAYLTRQFGVVLFPIALISLLSQSTKRDWSSFRVVLMTGCVLLVITLWVQSFAISEGLPYVSNLSVAIERIQSSPGQWWNSVLRRMGGIGLYIGMLSIPVLPALAPDIKRSNLWVWGGLLSLSALGTSVLSSQNPFSPFRGNMFYAFGLGPQTLPDLFTLHQADLSIQYSWGVAVLIMLSLLSFMVLLFKCLSHRRQLTKSGSVYLIGAALLYLLTLFLPGTFFDRYVLPAWWTLLVVLASEMDFSKFRMMLTISLTICFALFSFVATTDYLNWQQTRWSIQGEARSRGILPEQIDGGYEVNGWLGNDILEPGKQGYDIHNPGFREYLITFTRIPETEVLETRIFDRLLTPGIDTIYLLKRSAAPED
ncbi:MAG: glycosyltransferase family 39 protein [Saprospiraceae bacterium]|nr:glycosyltransferase family 39 protein [Saprospiraceae bacterium]